MMADMKVLVVFVIGVLIGGCAGHSFKMGGCPKVKVMKDFQMSKFLGDWYVIGRYNPTATCTKVLVDKTPEGIFTAEESSRPFGFNIGLHHYRRPRKLIIVKNDTEAIFKVSHQFRSFGLNTYGVLDTDYETYAIIWGCDPALMGSLQNLDILSRTPDSDANFEIMKNAKDMAERKGIDVKPLGRVEQANCLSSKKDGPNMVVDESHGMEVE